MFARFQSNYSLACRLKINSSVCFSPVVAEAVDHIASWNQMHSEALVVALINIAATVCENSKVYRANRVPLPMNIYNLVVARSFYGKSPILDLVRKSIDEVIVWRPEKFKSIRRESEESDQIVYFDENTSAGLLSSLQGCTRVLITDEADVVLKKMNYTLMSPNCREIANNDCRSQLLTFYDRPHNFTRRLKSETVQVFDAKLNILGAASGDLIIGALTRQASGSMADALFERTVIWPLDGDVIPTASCVKYIDEKKYMSLEQFSVVMSFMENFNLFFTIDANERMIEWSDYLKKRSAAEKGHDHLAARLGKCVQYAHPKYLSSNGHFPINGTITKEFVDEVKILFDQQFSQYNTHDHQYLVTLEMVERCRDMLTGNLEQYNLLMYVAPEERAMGITQSSSSLTFSKTEFPNEPLSKKQKRVIKLQPRLAEIMSRILLF
ncbi:unnamed protein product [Rotaria magnacalcarata]|uniref:DUF3987 domain-containing protein n=1 Tax=Rotaria magnacalcarata TaxID=392030 RepID=A0A816XFI9_9BILA|nr:unnamed protein product [Rotaria magnacalcarata]